MTTTEFIKLAMISAGYVKNLSVEIENTDFGEKMYSCYGETYDYIDDGTDVSAIDELGKDISIDCECTLLDLLREIMDYKQTEFKHQYELDLYPLKDILDDEKRMQIIKNAEEEEKRILYDIEKMKPVDEYIMKNNPCNEAPNCKGNFDNKDTCHSFWKCTHQYHNNCPLQHEYREKSQKLRIAYRKKLNGEEVNEEEQELLEKIDL